MNGLGPDAIWALNQRLSTNNVDKGKESLLQLKGQHYRLNP